MELGSNYELDVQALKDAKDPVFYYLNDFDTLYFDSGRSAIRALIPLLEKGSVLLPNYICKSVTDMFRNHFEIQFYKLNADFSINLSDLLKKINEKVKVIYVMNYFGTLQNPDILEHISDQKKKYGFTIIEDTTHSIFTNLNTIGDYCICSLRKWFPIADGGVLYTRHKLPDHLPFELEKKKTSAAWDAMILKHWFLEKGINCNALYRQLFEEAEEKLDKQQNIFLMSDLSKTLLQYFSVKEISERRKKNYQWMARYYSNHSGCGIVPVFQTEDFVPLTFPVYAKKRDELRKHLMEHKIYCAVHWPLEGTGLCKDMDAENKSSHILSLPIDQRYEEDHMEYLCHILDKFEG